MKISNYLFLLILSFASLVWAAEATVISSNTQLFTGENAQGVIGDYLLKNDSVSFIISDIPNTLSPGKSGGNLIDAAINSGVDDFDLMYLYLDKTWPRQAVYSSITIISSGTPHDSAHIRVTGVDSDNSWIGIVTDYILYDNTKLLKVKTTFTNNNDTIIHDYGMGDAFSWGSSPFVAGESDSSDWLASRTSNTIYGYTSLSRFAAIHGSYWSDATLEEVTLSPDQQSCIERYFMVGNSLQDIYGLYMNTRDIIPGIVSGSVTTEGNPAEEAMISFIKADETGASFETQTDASGDYSAELEPGNWICRVNYLGQSQVEYLQVSQSTTITQDFALGVVEPETMGEDTLTIIQSPLINIPQFALPGDTVYIELDLPVSEFVTSLVLMINGRELPLNYSEISLPSPFGLRTIEAYLPDTMLYGLYCLKMNFTGDIGFDVSEQSVCVIPEYKSDFTFVQVTDTHLPSHLYWGDVGLETDSTEIVDFREVINDINIINPDFVIHTGDFINDGEIESLGIPSYSRAKKQLHELDVPLYLVAGNHDLGGWDATPAPDGTSRRTWWKYFGWKHLNSIDPNATTTQDYSFDYGTVHFIGLETYINYDEWRYNLYGEKSLIPSQIQWLANDLNNNSDAEYNIMFYHMDFKREFNLSSLGIDAAFWGHVHGNNEDSTPPYDISTGATCDGGRWYRIIRISNNNIVFNQAVRAGSSGDILTLTEINDHTKRINNNHPFSLENCMVTFEIEDGMKFTSLTNATIFQIDSLAVPTIVYALADVPANAYVDVSIQKDTIETAIDIKIPTTPFLMEIYPNPFNPTLTIDYSLSSTSMAQISIYNMLGKEIVKLTNSQQDPGNYQIKWTATEQPSGLYFIKADIKNASGDFQSVEKCLLMK